MLEIGTRVEYGGREYEVIEQSTVRADAYRLMAADGSMRCAMERYLRVISTPEGAPAMPKVGKARAPLPPEPVIEKEGGHLYLNFVDNLTTERGDKAWERDEVYVLPLTEQYSRLKRKLGRYAPNTLQELIEACCPREMPHTYYVSMPALDRKQEEDAKGVKRIRNLVIRPKRALAAERYIPKEYDLILIGDIRFSNTIIDISIKGIDVIDAGTVKYGEKAIRCYGAPAFTTKTFPLNGREVTVPDYGADVRSPVLTHDFIKKLCEEVHPIPDPASAYRTLDEWQRYLDFRRYYLGVQSNRHEEIVGASAVPGYVVSKREYKRHAQEWEPLLLDGHKEFAESEQVLLSAPVDDSQEFTFIRVTIERNRKEVLADTITRGDGKHPRYENELFRFTREPMGLSEVLPRYDERGMVTDRSYRPYLLGERVLLTKTDCPPDCSDIEKSFERGMAQERSDIAERYARITQSQVEEHARSVEARLKREYAEKLVAYRAGLAAALARDVAENADGQVKKQYEERFLRPIEREYEERIKKLRAKKTVHDPKKSADKIAALDEEIATLTEMCKAAVAQAQAENSVEPLYIERNGRLVEEKREEHRREIGKRLEREKGQKRQELEARNTPSMAEDERQARERLRRAADEQIKKRVEADTVRRYEIYFRPDVQTDSVEDVAREMGDAKQLHYLTYDNRAERAKLERQEKALRTFRNGFVKNPYLASYLFAPHTLAASVRAIPEEPDWYLESLNERQKDAVRRALASESIFLLQGPPGTGKTQVIAEVTAQLAKQGKKVLISSETHKAIDNVFERLPKIPEIRPLRLIPAKSGKDTQYSPERLVDNFYLNIWESMGREVKRYDSFQGEKGKFSEKMNELRLKYDTLLALEGRTKETERKRRDLNTAVEECKSRVETLRERLSEIAEEHDTLTRTEKSIKACRFDDEGCHPAYIGRFREGVRALLSELDCFADKAPEDVCAMLTADPARVKAEVDALLGDGKAARMEAEREAIRQRLAELRDRDTDEPPMEGEPGYDEYRTKRERLIELGKSIKELKRSGEDADLSGGELAKLVSPTVMTDAERVSRVGEQLRELKARLSILSREVCEGIARDSRRYQEKQDALEAEKAELLSRSNRARLEYEELGKDGALAEYNECASGLRQSIVHFFRDFDIVREYRTTAEALDIIQEEWEALDAKYERGKAENAQRIPMLKRICRYLEASDTLEEDRLAYTRKLYENANVFGLTCTSRDSFSKAQNQELERYGIDKIDIRTQGIDVVIVDEVSKSSFLDLLIPLLYGKTVILVGDHRQLPPMYDLKHMRAEDFATLDEGQITKRDNERFTELYEECFFKTLYERVPEAFRVMLNKQYRCHSHIMEVFNHFYGGREHGLSVGKPQQDEERQHELTVRLNGRALIEPRHHIAFVDCDKKEMSETGSTSKMNPQEADVVMALLRGLDEAARAQMESGALRTGGERDERLSVGVICTYGDQAGLIQKLRRREKYKGFSEKSGERLVISTVDDFQGDERDIIIVSMVRNPKDPSRAQVEFVKQFERINVALSRARRLLIVVGAARFLSEQVIDLPDLSGDRLLDRKGFPVYREIIDTIKLRGKFLTADEVIGD